MAELTRISGFFTAGKAREFVGACHLLDRLVRCSVGNLSDRV